MSTVYETIEQFTVVERRDFMRTITACLQTGHRFNYIYTKHKTFIPSYHGMFKYCIDGCGSRLLEQFYDYAQKTQPVLPQPNAVAPSEFLTRIDIKKFETGETPKTTKPKKRTFLQETKETFRTQYGYRDLTDAQCSLKFVKRIVRNHIPSDRFMMAVSLECKGQEFWKAVNKVMLILKKEAL